MKIVVPIKFVPDLVEELSIDSGGTALDTSWLRLIINEFDDHAVEQAVLLKERGEGEITVVAAEAEGVDDFLFTAAAKGVDRLIKFTGDFGSGWNSHASARMMVDLIKEIQPDLILTGVQAHNDMDGSLGPLLAELLGMPYVGYVAGLALDGDKVIVRKEYPGGVVAEMEVKLPAVIGIQAAEQPPRYVTYNRIRQVLNTANIEQRPLTEIDFSGGAVVGRMFQPDASQRATILDGSADEVADQLVGVFKELGVM